MYKFYFYVKFCMYFKFCNYVKFYIDARFGALYLVLTLNKAGRLQEINRMFSENILFNNTSRFEVILCIIGIDVGTSGCKATIIDFEGNVKGAVLQGI